MGIPLDAISVVIRNSSAEKRLKAGMAAVRRSANPTFRTDGEISAVSFQSDIAAFSFIQSLEVLGLRPGQDFSTLDGLPPWVAVQDGTSGPEFVLSANGSPEPKGSVSTELAARAVSAAIQQCRTDLDTARLPKEYYYAGLPQCVIDSVFSIGVRYESTRKTVRNWCERQQPPWPVFQGDPGPEPTLEDFVGVLRSDTPQQFAENEFHNRQRTSTGAKGILKAEATLLVSEVLLRHRINKRGDTADPVRAAAAKDEIVRQVPGQSSGIAFDYFLMLAGADNEVKADRMIRRFVGRAIGLSEGQLASQELSVGAVAGASEILRQDHPHMTPRLLDYLIWEHERGRR